MDINYSERALFPWQISQWQQLMSCQKENRLPHALLLMGAEGLGKKHFALHLSEALLCNQPEAPCGQCHACHLLRAQSHPDFLRIEPEKPGQMIKIDQIREATQFLTETALKGVLRIVLIDPAAAMNIYSANALLKTLEEPAPNTLIILISSSSTRLPATIVSRCQKIIFQKPSREEASRWLQNKLTENSIDLTLLLNICDGAPLKVKEYLANGCFTQRQALYQGLVDLAAHRSSPLKLAQQFQESDLQTLFNLILIWLQDLLALKLTDSSIALINFDFQNTLVKLSQAISCDKLFNYLEDVKKNYAFIKSSLNLNRQLVLEDLFIRWMQYATG